MKTNKIANFFNELGHLLDYIGFYGCFIASAYYYETNVFQYLAFLTMFFGIGLILFRIQGIINDNKS